MNTEKRYLLAVVLSFVVIFIFYGPMMAKRSRPVPGPSETLTQQPPIVSEVVPQVKAAEPAALPTEKTYELHNDIYTAEFTTRSGGVLNLRLKEWGKRKMGEVNLIEKNSEFGPAFSTSLEGDSILDPNTMFEVEKMDATQNEINFVHEVPGQYRIRKTYQLLDQKSALKLSFQYENLSSVTKNVKFSITNQLHIGKSHDRYELDQLESFVSIENGKVVVRKEGKIKKQSFVVEDKIDWQALTRKYLAVILKPNTPAAYSETVVSSSLDALQNKLGFAPVAVAPNTTIDTNFVIYAGPEYYDSLKEFGLEETLIQGTWGAFRHWLFLALVFCKNLTGAYGWAIILMTFLLKVLFSPLTHMSFDSMRKMQAIQPKLKSIQEQYKKDPSRMNRETMEIYRKYKINPMGGCFPMLIQIPIFIGFYQVLAQFVELKGQSFFWIKDLTLPDRLAQIPGVSFDINILQLLMIVTMILQQKMTPQPATSSPEQAKVMQFMPIIFGFLFYGLPSGLVLYWTLNNLLTVIHQKIIHGKKVAVLTD